MRWVRTRVLPEPAPASTSSGPSPCVTAARCGSLRPSSRRSIRSAEPGTDITVEDREASGWHSSGDAAHRGGHGGRRRRSRRRPGGSRSTSRRSAPSSAPPRPSSTPPRTTSRAARTTSRRSSSAWTRSTSAPAGCRRSASGRACPATSRWPRGWPSASAPTGPWSAAELRAMRTEEIADALGQARDHELMALYAQALRELGRWLGGRGDARGRARGGRLGRAPRRGRSPRGMAMFDDRGFYKRAQIVGVRPRARRRRALRATSTASRSSPTTSSRTSCAATASCVYDPRLAAHVDAERPLRTGPQEREIRAGAVHACELIARAARRQRRTARPLAVEARAGAGVQGAAAPPLPHGLLLRTPGGPPPAAMTTFAAERPPGRRRRP